MWENWQPLPNNTYLIALTNIVNQLGLSLKPTVRLEKAIGSKGKKPCKSTASETQTHGQSFQKKVAGMGLK